MLRVPYYFVAGLICWAFVCPVPVDAQNVTQRNFTAWNVGLEEIYASSRLPDIIEALNTSTSDVLCLSEVWGGLDIHVSFVENLKGRYPYYFSAIDSYINQSISTGVKPTLGDDACDGSDVIQFGLCVNTLCRDEIKPTAPYDDTLACVQDRCRSFFQKLYESPTCASCVFDRTNYNRDSFTDAVKYCAQSEAFWAPTYGLLVLSAVPIEKLQVIPLTATLAPRGSLIFSVPSWNQTAISCNHWATVDAPIFYPTRIGSSTSWEAENLGQAQQIFNVMQTTYANYSNQIIAGDLNFGPAVPSMNVTATAPATFDVVNNAGIWLNVYVQTEANCTVCPENNLVPGTSKLYDHIFQRGPQLPVASSIVRRVFNETVNSWNATTLLFFKTYLSDHYGLELSVNVTV
eukprot:GILJ01012438.1.p1 GENE.GILJ01012438.1~~GILJ01012438.1.p1  ORF type:complete len:403 (-),score=43.42 GILJ01012438.1:144-1352(-)